MRMGRGEREAFLGRPSEGRQNASHVCVLRWRRVFERKNTVATQYRFGFPFASSVGDSLMCSLKVAAYANFCATA